MEPANRSGPKSKITSLYSLLEEHCAAVEADLAHWYRIDLGGVFTGRLTWRRLAVLLDHLPAESATRTAIRDSMTPEELAAQPVREGDGPWSLTDHLLARVGDGIDWLVYAKTDGNGEKPKPWPRPGTKAATVSPINPAAREYLENLRQRHREGA